MEEKDASFQSILSKEAEIMLELIRDHHARKGISTVSILMQMREMGCKNLEDAVRGLYLSIESIDF